MKNEIETPWMGSKAKKVSGAVDKAAEKTKKRFSDKGLMEAMDLAEKCPSRANLEKVYQVAWAAGGFGFCPPLSPKERGHLTQILNACPSTEVGVYVIVDVTQNWELFVAHMKKIMKNATPPDTPNVAYILGCKMPVLTWVTKRAKELAVQALAPAKESSVWKDFL